MSIFVQFWWNLVKMTTSWLGQIAKISAWYHQKCGFFINDTFLSQFAFSWGGLYVCTDYLLSNRDVSAENNLAATYNLEDPILQTEGRFYLITKSRPDCYMKEKDGWIWLDTLHLFSKIWFWVAFYGAWLPSGCSELSFFLMLSCP